MSIIKYLLFTYLFVIILSSCEKDNGSICPAVISIPTSPYDDPVWHPSGDFIGFNHKPIKEIKYTYGFDCPRQARYIYEDDSIGFWLINKDGSNKRRVLPYKLQMPAWSPDGQWIAFGAGAQIFKMPFDGSQFDTAAIEQLTFEGRNFFPAWSPDGLWIAYDSNVDSPTGLNFIWKMTHNGLMKRRIAHTPNKGETRMPSWGMDYSIIHQRYIGVSAPELFIMDSAGLNVRRITTNTDGESFPKFSPKSKNQAAYISQSHTEGGIELWTIDLTNSVSNKLTKTGAISFSWSPEGKIVYLNYDYSRIDEGKGALWVMDADGTNQRQLTFNYFIISN